VREKQRERKREKESERVRKGVCVCVGKREKLTSFVILPILLLNYLGT
jgi:hypothetical protein